MKPLELNHQNHQIKKKVWKDGCWDWLYLWWQEELEDEFLSLRLLEVFLHSFKLYFDAFGGTVVSFACFGGPSHFVVVVVSF